MPHARHNDKRDGNDTSLTHVLERFGCDVWHLGRTPCDKIILCPDGRLVLAEIKDPTQPFRVTDTERDTMLKLEARGQRLWILQTAEDCAALVSNRADLLTVNRR